MLCPTSSRTTQGLTTYSQGPHHAPWHLAESISRVTVCPRDRLGAERRDIWVDRESGCFPGYPPRPRWGHGDRSQEVSSAVSLVSPRKTDAGREDSDSLKVIQSVNHMSGTGLQSVSLGSVRSPL